jgi:hypothetical protein
MTMNFRHIVVQSAAIAGAALALGACAPASHTDGVNPSSLPYSLMIDNRSDLEVVVYAVTSPGVPGVRLGSARSFGKSMLTVPQTVLQSSNDFVVQLHAIGQANKYDWLSPRVTMGDDVVAKLDIRSTGMGDMSMSSFYTESASYALPMAMKRGH